jgi:hypothetical protein
MKLPLRTSPEIELLPPAYKWEFLRRHPLYLVHWKWNNLYMEVEPGGPVRLDPSWPRAELASRVIGQLTGGPEFRCPDPARSAAELARGFLLTKRGEENARQASFRELVELFLLLPEPARKAVGAVLSADASADKESDLMARREAITRLTDKELDKAPPGVVVLNLQAPLRGLLSRVKEIVTRQKREKGIKQSRPRPDVLEEYLQAWDAREGWDCGQYRPGREKTLRVIAMETGTPIATVRDRYRAAYRLVFAEEYDPLRWMCWFPKKVNLSALAKRRKPKTQRESVTEIPETALSAGVSEESDGVVKGEVAAEDDLDYRDLVSSISDLLKKGVTDSEEVIARLDVEGNREQMKKAIEYIRDRGADGLL